MKEQVPQQRRVRFEVALSTLERDLKEWGLAWKTVHNV